MTLAGASVTATDTSSGAQTSWQATYPVADGDSGDVAFSISYADAAGNAGESRNESSVENTITLDTATPSGTLR